MEDAEATYNGQMVSGSRSRSLSSGTLGSFANIYRMLAPVNCHNIALRYTAPSGTTAGGDYTRYSKTARNRFSKMAIICWVRTTGRVSTVTACI